MSSSDEQDALDMERLATGKDSALNDLMERHGEPLFHYLIRQLQNETDAADLAQETFVRVYQNRSKYRAGQKFTRWLYTIATNLARDRHRWKSRHRNVSLEAELETAGSAFEESLPQQTLTPSERLDANERSAMIQAAVAELPEDLRTPLILAEYEDMPQTEIADILECTPKAVETRIYRARKQLRARLELLEEQ